MKLGIYSDVHGNPSAFKAALDILGDVDAYLFAGDLCGYYAFVNDCVDLWPAKPVWAVRGNHDQVMIDCREHQTAPPEAYTSTYGTALARSLPVMTTRAKDMIAAWPVSQAVHIDKVTIQLVHGAPWDPLEGRVYPDFTSWERFANVAADVIVMGHTHYAMAKQVHGKWVLNPGSIGQPRDRGGVACCARLDLATMVTELLAAPYVTSRVVNDARAHDPQLPYLFEVMTR